MDATESLTVQDIAPLRGPRPPMSKSVARDGPPDRHTVTRRRFTQAAVAAATGLGLASLGVFPPARQAFADGYDMISGLQWNSVLELRRLLLQYQVPDGRLLQRTQLP